MSVLWRVSTGDFMTCSTVAWTLASSLLMARNKMPCVTILLRPPLLASPPDTPMMWLPCDRGPATSMRGVSGGKTLKGLILARYPIPPPDCSTTGCFSSPNSILLGAFLVIAVVMGTSVCAATTTSSSATFWRGFLLRDASVSSVFLALCTSTKNLHVSLRSRVPMTVLDVLHSTGAARMWALASSWKARAGVSSSSSTRGSLLWSRSLTSLVARKALNSSIFSGAAER
mmetsp:Transcript_39337/g.77023  ORF Transcript_39337/g.77023 Transcript_39337/m.77023 type:complete len:229 (+) Transcript_39337:390-1076(+)